MSKIDDDKKLLDGILNNAEKPLNCIIYSEYRDDGWWGIMKMSKRAKKKERFLGKDIFQALHTLNYSGFQVDPDLIEVIGVRESKRKTNDKH